MSAKFEVYDISKKGDVVKVFSFNEVKGGIFVLKSQDSEWLNLLIILSDGTRRSYF